MMNTLKDPNQSPHIPILLEEVITSLDIQPNDIVLDGTIGFGGHSSRILKHLSDKGKLFGLDQDPAAISFCQKRFQNAPNLILENTNFADFPKILEKHQIKKVNKILLDLGMSSYQLDLSKRGFTFQGSEPLDLRMNPQNPLTAAEILNTYTEEQLLEIFKNYGELYKPEKFVSKIIANRKTKAFLTTDQLVSSIKSGFYFHNKRFLYLKTCAQVFQALRIEVNQELANLTDFLNNVLEIMAAPKKSSSGSRLAILSFHSLEDRIIKQFGKAHKNKLKNLPPKVIHPSQTEIKNNIRAKSAKLRVFEKIAD